MRIKSSRWWKRSHVTDQMGIPRDPLLLNACKAAWRDPNAIDPRTSPDMVMAMMALRIAEIGLKRYLEERPDTSHHPAQCFCHACRLADSPQAILFQVRNVRSILECDTPDSIATWLTNLELPSAEEVVDMLDHQPDTLPLHQVELAAESSVMRVPISR